MAGGASDDAELAHQLEDMREQQRAISGVLMARAGRDPAPQVPFVEYAKINVISARELAHAVARLEAWCAAPTW